MCGIRSDVVNHPLHCVPSFLPSFIMAEFYGDCMIDLSSVSIHSFARLFGFNCSNPGPIIRELKFVPCRSGWRGDSPIKTILFLPPPYFPPLDGTASFVAQTNAMMIGRCPASHHAPARTPRPVNQWVSAATGLLVSCCGFDPSCLTFFSANDAHELLSNSTDGALNCLFAGCCRLLPVVAGVVLKYWSLLDSSVYMTLTWLTAAGS